MEFFVNTDSTRVTFQTVRWPSQPIILSIGHCESPTEVQLNSAKKPLASDSKTVCNSRLSLSKAQLIFFNGWFGNCIISKELTLKEFLYDVMLH